jgi:hypothetical protein
VDFIFFDVEIIKVHISGGYNRIYNCPLRIKRRIKRNLPLSILWNSMALLKKQEKIRFLNQWKNWIWEVFIGKFSLTSENGI